jgi:hypothetical protein
MNRRQFIKYSAIQSMVLTYPSVTLSGTLIVIRPSGGDDTDAINTALRASARVGEPAILAEGAFTITDTIYVPPGSRLIGQGKSSCVAFKGGKAGVVIRIGEPHNKDAVQRLFVEDRRSPVPFMAMIGSWA